MYTLEADSLGVAWINAMRLIMSRGEQINDDKRKLKEIRNLYITIDTVSEDDVIIANYADKKRIKLMKEKYATCGLVGDYKIDYGSYIYDNNGINQINWVRDRILRKPETKSATITLHHPGEEMLACLSLLDFKLRNNTLYMNVVYRSQNIYFSHPGNLIALRKIQEDLSKELNVSIGNIDLIVMSAHIYSEDYQKVADILKSESMMHK